MSAVRISDHASRTRLTVATYVVGFVLSVLLSLAAFWIVGRHALTGGSALFVIFSLALLQFSVQVLCFLHLAEEERPRHKLVAFLFMILVVLILAGGSVWIMNNLNYHMQPPLSPAQQDRYLHEHEGL